MKRILVATDGSEGAKRAVAFAIDLAGKFGADLVAANIIGGYGLPGDIVGSFNRPELAWLRESLEAWSAETLTEARERALAAGIKTVRLESRRGHTAQTIVEIANDTEADAIVVGRRGQGEIEGLLLGSVSQKLVTTAKQIVIVVP